MLYRLLGKIGPTSHFHFDFILLLLFSIEAIQWISILIANQNLLFQITKWDSLTTNLFSKCPVLPDKINLWLMFNNWTFIERWPRQLFALFNRLPALLKLWMKLVTMVSVERMSQPPAMQICYVHRCSICVFVNISLLQHITSALSGKTTTLTTQTTMSSSPIVHLPTLKRGALHFFKMPFPS